VKSRFSTVAGILAAASLLSGSAFAFAPEFTGDLPTVIITDRISEGAVSPPQVAPFDAPDGGSGIAFRPSSAFLFRYDDAVDLTPLIQLNDANSINDVQVVFNEFDAAGDLTPNSTTTLQINGNNALTSIPSKADFSGANAFTAGLLSFRNIDFSDPANQIVAGEEKYDEIGDLTGQDLSLSPSQSRIVSLYIDTVASTQGGGDATSFEVITTLDGGDRLSQPTFTDPFVPPVYDTDSETFGDWWVAQADNRILGIESDGPDDEGDNDQESPNLDGFTIDPNVTKAIGTPLPAGRTNPLSIESSAAQLGLMGFGLANDGGDPNDGIDLDANKLYRLRVNWQSSDVNANAPVFIQFGDVFNTGTVNAGYSDPSDFSNTGSREFPIVPGSATDFDAYLLTQGASQTQFSISIIDTNASDGNEIQINSVEVGENTRDSLQGGTVLKNFGGASFTVAAGQPIGVDDTGRADFSEAPGPLSGTPGDQFFSAAGLNNALPETLTITGSEMTAQFGPAPTTADYWESAGFNSLALDPLDVSAIDTGIVLDQEKIYILDVWASTDNAGEIMPQLLIRNGVDSTMFSATGFHTGGATGITVNPDIQLASDAKVYSNVFAPQTPNTDGGRTTMNVQFLWALSGFGVLDNTTTNIHRVILTEYDPF